MFYVGPENGGGTIAYLGTGVSGYGDLTKATTTPAILTDYQVMGLDMPYNFEGLVTVDSSTQFIDLRDGRPGDIDELSDLFDGDKCDNSTVELKILLNGNKDSGSFRHAYVVMVLNAKPSVDGSGSSDGKTNGTAVSTSYKINERNGIVVYTVKADRPDWVPADESVTVDITGTIYVDDIPNTISTRSGSGVVYDKNRNASYTTTVASYSADADSEVRIVIDEVKWSHVKVTYEAPEKVTVTPAFVATGVKANTLAFVIDNNTAYRSGKVVVSQKGDELLTQEFDADDLGGSLKTIAIGETKEVGIEGAVEVKVTLQTTVFDVNGPTDATEKPVTNAPSNGSGVKEWVTKNLEPGVYVLEGLKQGNHSGNWSDPFDQTCDSRDTRVFVYQRNGEQGDYTLTIGENGSYFNEKVTVNTDAASTEKGLFNVQVGNKYSDVFHNSGTNGTNGSMAGNGTPMNGNSANWKITSPTGVVLAAGTITVDAVPADSTYDGSQSTTVRVGEFDPLPDDTTSDEYTEALQERATALTEAIIDQFRDGAHKFPDISTILPSNGAHTSLWFGGNSNGSDNRFFKFTTGDVAEKCTFVLYGTDGSVKHRETHSYDANESAFIYICVTGSGVGDNYQGPEDDAVKLKTPLGNGSYRWVVRGEKSGILTQGELVMS